MRVLIVAVFALSALLAARPSAAAPTTSLDVSAGGIEYYSDRYVVNAGGGVRVRLSDGTVVRGDTFAMDLKSNRWIVAGFVRVDGPGIHRVGAAMSGFLDLDKTYFLPADATPDRLTFFGLNWSDAHPGRDQPGDAFAFPDLPAVRPFVRARTASIIPKENVTFGGARVALGAYAPTERYVVTFSANSHFYENAFSGARFDIGVPYNGSAHSLSALHVRNNPVNGTYLSFDQHFVWDKDWIVFGVDPLTQPQRQYNLIGYKRFSPGTEGRIFSQVSANGGGIAYQPNDAAAFTQLQINTALPHSGLQFTNNHYYQYILGLSENDPDFRHREHPTDALLAWTGVSNKVARTPVFFQQRSGLGYAHDQFGYATLPGQPPTPDAWYHYVGATLFVPQIKLTRDTSFTLSGDRQFTWYNVPHVTDVMKTTASIGRIRPRYSEFIAYTISNYRDLWGAQQLIAYPPIADTVTNQFGTFSGLRAFRGLATARTATVGLTLNPSTSTSLALQYQYEHDSPGAVPGVYGTVPNILTGTLTTRITPHIGLQLTRAYYFNFANYRWQPQTGIQFTP